MVSSTTHADYDRRPEDSAVRVIDSEAVLTAEQLKAEIERLVGPGPVRRLMVFPPTSDDPTTVRYEATTADGYTVRGTVGLDGSWLDGAMQVEPVVAVNVVEWTHTAAEEPRQLLQRRLDEIAARLRRLLVEVRVRPDIPAHELAGELQRVVELAERR